MDEIEDYCDRIERRRGDRRLKNDRRVYTPEPKFFDAGFYVSLAILFGFAALFYFA